MLPTPTTSHINFSNIYEPSEDSYLLLDALSQDSETKFLSERFRDGPCPLILEVGTGSGIVLAFATANAKTIFGRADVLAMGTDVNHFACVGTAHTVRVNVTSNTKSDGPHRLPTAGTLLDPVNGSLTSPLRNGSVDVLVFNPPYVPSDTVPKPISMQKEYAEPKSRDALFERDSQLLALATDGGLDGMEITNQLLAQLPNALSPQRGVTYLLLCAQNKPEAVKQTVRGWGSGWSVETVRKSGKHGGWEKLEIVRIARSAD